jgi:hypothetical protein
MGPQSRTSLSRKYSQIGNTYVRVWVRMTTLGKGQPSASAQPPSSPALPHRRRTFLYITAWLVQSKQLHSFIHMSETPVPYFNLVWQPPIVTNAPDASVLHNITNTASTSTPAARVPSSVCKKPQTTEINHLRPSSPPLLCAI